MIDFETVQWEDMSLEERQEALLYLISKLSICLSLLIDRIDKLEI